jgi:hypothetical protein
MMHSQKTIKKYKYVSKIRVCSEKFTSNFKTKMLFLTQICHKNSSKCLAATLMYLSAVLPTNSIVHGDQEIPELMWKPGVSIHLTDHKRSLPCAS